MVDLCFITTNKMCTRAVCRFPRCAARALRIGDSDGQLGRSFHNGLAVLGDVVSNLSTVRSGRDNQYMGKEACLEGAHIQLGRRFGSFAFTEGRAADT